MDIKNVTTTETFNKYLKLLQEHRDTTRLKKNKEYTGENKDRLHNFRVTASRSNTSEIKAAVVQSEKHGTSIMDIVEYIDKKKELPENVTEAYLLEKFGDYTNYYDMIFTIIMSYLNKDRNIV